MKILPQPEVISGDTALSQIPTLLKGIGTNSVMVVTDQGIINAGIYNKLSTVLNDASIEIILCDEVKPDPSITLVKKISEIARNSNVGAVIGLGGGSSDAATTLVALNELWKIGKSHAELASLGLKLGADVPVFVHGHAAWAEGVGEELTPLESSEGTVLVVHPGCSVPTAEIFAHPQLTRDTPTIKIHDLESSIVSNDCEAVTRKLFPEVAHALDWLGQFGDTRMSGTGACVYGLFDSISRAERAAATMPKQWAWFVAQRRNISPLMETLTAIGKRD